MDQCTNVSLNRILYNSKENSELILNNVSRHSEINVNFRSQFRKKYGNKNKKEECVFRDLSKIEKQVTYLSSGKADYLAKMLPENNDNSIPNHKIASAEPVYNHAISARESIEQVQCDINVNRNMLSVSQEQLFSNNKPFPQITQTSNLAFSVNKLLDEDKSNSISNVNYTLPFTECSNKVHADNNADDSNDNEDEDNDDDDGNEFNGKMQKNKRTYTAFEFDGDSSGIFEFSLEGEKLVSSLCGPQGKCVEKDRMHNNKLLVYNKPSQDLNYTDTFKSTTIDKSTSSFLSKQLDTRVIFSNAVTSTPEKSNSNRIHEYHIHHEVKSNKSHEQENKMIELEHSLNACGLNNEHAPNDAQSFILNRSNKNEKKPVLSVDPCIFARTKQSQGKDHVQGNVELCTLFQGNVLCAEDGRNAAKAHRLNDINGANKSHPSVPDIFSVLNKFNHGKFSIASSNMEAPIRNDEQQSESTDSCDDDISFRKSAIKGCLVFERVIKDLHIANYQDLENYCKTVKRCVSVANSMEDKEFTVLISELIFCFLKLADSWGILNSYFGESGNGEYKLQNLDDLNLYQSFQDWQIKSKTLLDHLTVVIQNLKDSVIKGEEKGLKSVKDVQLPKVSQYNPFFSQPQVKSNSVTSINKRSCTNFPLTESVQKQENVNYQISSQFQSQEIQFPKNIATIFSAHNQNNWKPGLPETNQKKSDIWDIPQNNQQNVLSMQSVQSERKLRKKWMISMPQFQSDTAVCPVSVNPGLPLQQTQSAGPLPAVNFQYLTQTKAPVDNLMMQPINFFGNQYNPVPQNIQNIRDNATPGYTNFCQPQTLYANHNLKQSPKRKININLKPEEQFHKDVINSNAMYNRVNMCNPQMQIPLLQNNMNPNSFGLMDESKTNIIYQNFCIGDGKTLPPANSYNGAPFIQNEMFTTNPVPNQNMFCHKACDQKTMLPLPLSNCDGDDSSEEYYPVKSYMKPGSYRVPNKSKSMVMQSTNNLNYIFDDIIVTGITVPFTKSNIFSQSKKSPQKTTVNTNEKSIQTTRSDEVKNTDLAWKAAMESAEELGKALTCQQDEQTLSSKSYVTCIDKSVKVQTASSDEINKTSDDTQSFDSSNNSSSDNTNNQTKENNTIVIKTGSVKTDDWLIQSLSKLEMQKNAKDSSITDSTRNNEIESCSTKTSDTKSRSSDSKNNESEESDNTVNDNDSECCPKDKRSVQKKDKCNGVKHKTNNLKSVSILQKPREYCQSRAKPWDKTRDFSYPITPYKNDARNIHKNPANWIKYNRKCITRQTLYKLQDILNTLSKMETSDINKDLTNNQDVERVINVNAVNYKLKSHAYDNIDQILLDIKQMLNNGRDINKECSKTIEMINKLEFCFGELVEKYFGQIDFTDNREAQNGSLLPMKNRRTHKVQRKVN